MRRRLKLTKEKLKEWKANAQGEKSLGYVIDLIDHLELLTARLEFIKETDDPSKHLSWDKFISGSLAKVYRDGK